MDDEAQKTNLDGVELGEMGTRVEGELSAEALAVIGGADDARGPVLGPLLAALLAAVACGVIVSVQFPDFAVPGPWLGFATMPPGDVPGFLPPYWTMALHGLTRLGVSAQQTAYGLSGSGLVVGAAAVAAFVATLVRTGRAEGPTDVAGQALVGAWAGGVFFLTFPAQLARYSAGPEAFVAAAALWGMFLFYRAHQRPGLPLGLLGAALLVGVACAEQPYFLLLAAVCFFWLFLFGAEDGRQLGRFGMVGIGLVFALAWPALRAAQSGADPHALLAHAMRQTYPDFSLLPGEMPETPDGYFYWGSAALLTVAAVIASIWGGLAARAACLLLLLAAVLGPGMAYIANPPHEILVPQDVVSPKLCAVALVVAAGTAGAAAMFRKIKWALLRVPLTVLVCFGVACVPLYEGAERGPAPERERWRAIAEELVGGTPEGALFVVGRLDLASSLWAMQAVDGYRKDLRVVPSAWLVDPAGREAAQRIVGERVTLTRDFPNVDDMERWRRELPLHAAALKDVREEAVDSALAPFALWDVVTQEAVSRPVYFAGVDAPWLLARGTPVGHVLVFPAEGINAAPAQMPLGWQSHLRGESLAYAITDPVNDVNAAAAGARGETAWAGFACVDALDLPASAALQRLRETTGANPGVNAPGKQADVDLLWSHDRLVELRGYYEALDSGTGTDNEVLYQLAAVYAQLGEWDRAGDMLSRWHAALGLEDTSAFARVDQDGRFALLRRHMGAAGEARVFGG